jgi:AcrR family transcriptional regulator
MAQPPDEILEKPRVKEILARAASVYSRVGYSAGSIRDLAKALNIKSASLYHWFDSKEDILFAIMLDFHRSFVSEVTPVAELDGAPDQIMRQVVEAHIRFDVQRWDQVVIGISERRSLSPERRHVINRLRRQHRDAIVKLVVAGAAPGSWAAAEPKIVASVILDTINGLVQWYQQRGEADLQHIISIFASNAVALLSVPRNAAPLRRTTRRRAKTR